MFIFRGESYFGVAQRVFWAAELNFQGALDYLRGFDQVDNQMGWGYHRFQGKKCSRSAHLELIWEIPG